DRDRRHLHSFPTRRSSDLAPVQTDQHIIFNDSLVKERQHQKSTTFFNHLDYSILLGNRNILHNYFYFGGNYLHQNIDLNSPGIRSEEHTSELQSRENLVCS